MGNRHNIGPIDRQVRALFTAVKLTDMSLIVRRRSLPRLEVVLLVRMLRMQRLDNELIMMETGSTSPLPASDLL